MPRKNARHGLQCSKFLRNNFPDEYRSWRVMWARTLYPSQKDWRYYGGRGIFVTDERWRNFENFLEDVGEKPEPKHIYGLGRIDSNPPLGFCPENCKWKTKQERAKQARHPGRLQTRCHRGHWLTGENLVPSSLARGMRKCRKCARLNAQARGPAKKEKQCTKQIKLP
jgi:hypothetical protein